MIVHDPVLRIAFLEIHPFGFFVAIGFVIAYLLAWLNAARAGLATRYLPGLLLVVGLGSFVAARLAFVALHPASWHDGLEGVLAVWRGGLSLDGGLVGGTLLLAAYTWARREPFWRWADALAPAVAPAIALGMLGLPYSGEGWGEPTRGPFFMRVDVQFLPNSLINQTRFQPIFAYEALLFLALTIVLWLLQWRRRSAQRQATGLFGLIFILVAMAGYGALRPFTLDRPSTTLVLQTQSLCAGVVALAASLLVIQLWRQRRKEEITREMERVVIEQRQRQAAFLARGSGVGTTAQGGPQQR